MEFCSGCDAMLADWMKAKGYCPNCGESLEVSEDDDDS